MPNAALSISLMIGLAFCAAARGNDPMLGLPASDSSPPRTQGLNARALGEAIEKEWKKEPGWLNSMRSDYPVLFRGVAASNKRDR